MTQSGTPAPVGPDRACFTVLLDAERPGLSPPGPPCLALLAGLGPDAVARVRERHLTRLAADGVDAFDVAGLVGVGATLSSGSG